MKRKPRRMNQTLELSMNGLVRILSQALASTALACLLWSACVSANPDPGTREAVGTLGLAAANQTPEPANTSGTDAEPKAASRTVNAPAPIALDAPANKRKMAWMMLTALAVFLLLCWLKGHDMERLS